MAIVFDVVSGKDLSKGANVDTSKAAWKKVQAVESRQRVIDCLKADGNWGKTCKEMAAELSVPMHHVSGRITELIELGRVYKTSMIRDGGKVVRLV